MTIATDGRRRPAFTIGDRLRKARSQVAEGADASTFADLIGVSRNTVVNYELERTAPERMKPIVLRQWAMATGVDFEWLMHGDVGSDGGGGGGSLGSPDDGAPSRARTGDLRFTRSAVPRIGLAA